MKDENRIDYTLLDRPEVLMYLFHPRPEPGGSHFITADDMNRPPNVTDVMIPVAQDTAIGAQPVS